MMEHVINYIPDLVARNRAAIDPNFIRYARAKFPDMSIALIRQNLCEIITAYDAEVKCQSCCMGIDMCTELINSAGYTYTMTLQRSGWIKIEYIPCMFNGGKQMARDKKVAQFTQVEIFA